MERPTVPWSEVSFWSLGASSGPGLFRLNKVSIELKVVDGRGLGVVSFLKQKALRVERPKKRDDCHSDVFNDVFSIHSMCFKHF